MAEGAKLVALFEEQRCMGVAVFRIYHLMFLNGEQEICVDDFVITATVRSLGLGKHLLNWLKKEAKR